MKFLSSVESCSKIDGRIIIAGIRTEQGIFSVNGKIEENREKWKQHLHRMDETQIPKQPITYKV
jgi:hypothetical protein